MDVADELKEIADAMGALEQRFINSENLGLHLNTQDEAKFKRLTIEAKSLMDEALGVDNDFSMNLVHTTNTMRGSFFDGICLAGVRSARELEWTPPRVVRQERLQCPLGRNPLRLAPLSTTFICRGSRNCVEFVGHSI